MKKLIFAAAVVAGCAQMPARQPAVERMYVISCGENHVKNVSLWTPGVNVGKPHVFGNHCYLIKHAKGWMLWDTGNADRIAPRRRWPRASSRRVKPPWPTQLPRHRGTT
ncbi:MAG: hypothetical protein ACREVG_05995 [Burkholderiales bacterium]